MLDIKDLIGTYKCNNDQWQQLIEVVNKVNATIPGECRPHYKDMIIPSTNLMCIRPAGGYIHAIPYTEPREGEDPTKVILLSKMYKKQDGAVYLEGSQGNEDIQLTEATKKLDWCRVIANDGYGANVTIMCPTYPGIHNKVMYLCGVSIEGVPTFQTYTGNRLVEYTAENADADNVSLVHEAKPEWYRSDDL